MVFLELEISIPDGLALATHAQSGVILDGALVRTVKVVGWDGVPPEWRDAKTWDVPYADGSIRKYLPEQLDEILRRDPAEYKRIVDDLPGFRQWHETQD